MTAPAGNPGTSKSKEFIMGCIGKTVVRGTIITALAGGALVAVAGPQRVHALIHQTRSGINSVIDNNLEDPVVLRAQIRQLEAEYPEKINDVRSDLSEVQTQVAQLTRERQVATKVVQLASLDLAGVDAQLSDARAVQAANPGAIIRVSLDNRPVELDDAFAKRQQIEQTRDLYAARVRDLETDLTYLVDQETQLNDLLVRLESEQSEFQAKLFQLDAQIDTIARNERLIDMMEDRQATIDEHSQFQAHSLDQLNQRLASIRGEQRSRLESVTRRENTRDYVNEAEFLVDQDGRLIEQEATEQNLTSPSTAPVGGFLIQPQVIDLGPAGTNGSQSSVASSTH